MSDLPTKLQNCMRELLDEREVHKREREKLEENLRVTNITLDEQKQKLAAAGGKIKDLEEEIKRLQPLESQVLNLQGEIKLVKQERDTLKRQIQRLTDDLDATSKELRQQKALLQSLNQKHDVLETQAQGYDRITTLYQEALRQLLRVDVGLPLAVSPELQAAIDDFRKANTYGSGSII
ncbi:MAG: hypothetical protein WCJ55_05190 [Chloroflexales bacterium]